MKDFKGKVAVVTGAASGIGLGLAERCAKEGMKVVLADIEETALARVEKAVKAAGASTLAVKTDVSKAADVEDLARKTLDAFGAVHLLCNNAGVFIGARTWESTLLDWEWALGVNLWGIIHGVHFFVPLMIKQDVECYIVNTASVGGLYTFGGGATYVVSKHAAVAFSECLYREITRLGYKIGVSVLCPGSVRTKILDAERNRPTAFRNAPGEATPYLTDPKVLEGLQEFQRQIDSGLPPEKVAGVVFDAIRKNKFYILPNTESHKPIIRARLEDIIQERNPTGFTDLY
jgi:NAD(P)-dependent dehydrogenase (short-subunit alcohol dehydrogenase family)